ncbi:MAG: SDR family oxidoreductase [Alphaproteobacteria bacterium]
MTDTSQLPRHALITGAAHRIGAYLAKELAADGFAVVIHYNRSSDGAKALQAEIRNAGGTAEILQADLTQEDDVQKLLPAAENALGGPLGLLINNASLFEHDDAQTATRASWDAHMEANLRAPFVLSQNFAAALPETAEGLIINLLDQRIWKLTPQFVSYTLSKTGLWTLTQTLAQGLAPRIRVNAIGPGPTLRNARQTQAHFQKQLDGVVLERGPDLSEFIEAVRFMLTARSMTGQMIALDGGQHLGWQTPDIVGIVE